MTELNRKEAVKIVGRQYVVVDGGNSKFSVGTVVTLIGDDGSSSPKFLAEGASDWWFLGMEEVMLLAETEDPEPEEVTEFEVGTVYDDGDGDLLQVQEDGKKLRMYTDGDFNLLSAYGLNYLSYNWTVATAEQAAEFNKRKLQYQLDNLKVGEVYAVSAYYDWLIRVASVEGEKVFVTNSMTPSDGYYSGTRGHLHPKTVRPATADEIALLEAAEIKAGDREPVAEPVLPKHKFAVGDKLKVISSKGKGHCFGLGTEVAVIEIEEGNSHDGEIPKYKTEVKSGLCQYLLETQLEPVNEPKQLIPEVGKIYYADQTGKFDWDWTLQVTKVENGKVFHSGCLASDGDYYPPNFLYLGDVTAWTEATPEQAVKLLQAKVDHSDATEADLKQLSELMPLDNPELTVGEVYVTSAGGIERFALNSNYTGNKYNSKGTSLKSGNFYNLAEGIMYSGADEYRKALPHEVAKLEAAEKEHGCEYVKPLINSEGTVIQVGQYYSANSELLYVTEIGNYEVQYVGFEVPSGKIPLRQNFHVNSTFIRELVLATPAEIEQFKQAEAKANCKVKEGKKYKVIVAGTEHTVEIVRVGEGLITVKQTLFTGRDYAELVQINNPIWETAVEVTQHG